jgi:hypothetical protein
MHTLLHDLCADPAAVALCAVQILTVLIIGNVGDQKPQLFTNLRNARGVKALFGLAGGVCMGFGVCLMMQAAPMAGQAISFPVTGLT